MASVWSPKCLPVLAQVSQKPARNAKANAPVLCCRAQPQEGRGREEGKQGREEREAYTRLCHGAAYSFWQMQLMFCRMFPERPAGLMGGICRSSHGSHWSKLASQGIRVPVLPGGTVWHRLQGRARAQHSGRTRARGATR